jgi:hypothetical protein
VGVVYGVDIHSTIFTCSEEKFVAQFAEVDDEADVVTNGLYAVEVAVAHLFKIFNGVVFAAGGEVSVQQFGDAVDTVKSLNVVEFE